MGDGANNAIQNEMKIRPLAKFVVCGICGREFQYDTKTPNKKYCSPECREESMRRFSEEAKRKREELKRQSPQKVRFIKCAICGKEFQYNPFAHAKKYCSEECRTEAQKNSYAKKKSNSADVKIYKCKCCSKEYVYDPKENTRSFCSQKCKEKHYRRVNTTDNSDVVELVSYLIAAMNQATQLDCYTSVFFTDSLNPTEIQREAVLSRDKRKCRVCNSRSNLQIHHIVKRRDGGGNDLDNLITLCSKCHRHIETGNLEHALDKCIQNFNIVQSGESSVFSNHLNNLQKVEYAKNELEKLYTTISNSGEEIETESIKICIDDILSKLL